MKSLIHTPTSKIAYSLEFYKKLNFKVISKKEPVIVTDGKAVIEINPDRFARAGVKLFKNKWNKEVAKLKKLTAVHKTNDGYLLSDPSGVWIYLIERDLQLKHKPENKSYSVLGSFAGLSLESVDIVKSTEVWKSLGFKINGTPEQGWVSCANDEELTINIMKPLMCPHLFFNPSLTYFNGKENNPEVIKKIRALQIPITEEITHFNEKGIVDNIIIRDPGGYGFFIFND